ncbi:MAG: hypothetical protein GX963_05035 [Bacteroidales bacterium]|nr:hypothetical protein [Bacteroidales bacterium]
MTNENLFQKALDMCPAEIQIRFNYINDLLCDTNDEVYECFTNIQKLEVDEEVLEKINDFFEIAKVNRERVNLQRKLEYLEAKEDILEDMFDEMLLNILANLD